MTPEQEVALIEVMRTAFGSKQCHHHSDMIIEYWNDEYKINMYRKLHFRTERGKDYKHIINILTDCEIPFEIIKSEYIDNVFMSRGNTTIHIKIKIKW